ncbi:MAG: hypothetical protein AABM43_12880 [Actinomycetota bacterium]
MDEELEQARKALGATRGVVKASQRSLRTCSQFLADLDGRLAALDRTAEEAQRNDQDSRKISSTA